MVAIGASAGGLKAMQAFLSAILRGTRLALVFFQHLDPKHGSMLPEILARSARIPIGAPISGEPLQAGHGYVIGPEFLPEVANGRFVLRPHSGKGAVQFPIDHLMESVARDAGRRAIGVVLSGTGSDGTAGLVAIKAAGGTTFAQEAASADQPAMPANATAAGAVDFVLSPAAIAKRMGRLPVARAKGHIAGPTDRTLPAGEFRRILSILRARSSVDFTQYRVKTLRRRIDRRAMLRRCDTLAAYVRILEGEPQEVDALFQDVLLHVTGFFRDRRAFLALQKKVIPVLARPRTRTRGIRAWVAGCSTGEEAYSLAMVLAERYDGDAKAIPIHIFATDVNETSLARARRGWYTAGIAGTVGRERLARFFMPERGGYRIRQEIRNLCVFARHDVTTDPPFLSMDLILCRNVLIYLEPPVQKRVLTMFHYSLVPNGFLLLGTAETPQSKEELFEVFDAHERIYRRRPHTPAVAPNLLTEPVPRVLRPALPPPGLSDPVKADAEQFVASSDGPASVVVDARGRILQLRGRVRRFTRPLTGRGAKTILEVVKGDLAKPIATVLRTSRRTGEASERTVARREGGRRVSVVVRSIPLRGLRPHEPRFLVVLDDVASAPTGRSSAPRPKASAQRTRTLSVQLKAARASLQAVLEQQEATNEELRASNEEIVSSNEELQSTNEELEAAKEELQSANEELSTVNDQLVQRNAELDRSRNDLANLLSSSKMPIVMLDTGLRVRHFTEAAGRVANLIDGDLGRPLGDLRSNLEISDLESLAQGVLDTLEPVEREVRDRDGRWFSLRVRPYRTFDNHIDGVILLLLDIDDAKRAQQELQASADFARAIVDTFPDPVVVLEEGNRIRAANAAFYRFFEAHSRDVEGLRWEEVSRGAWDITQLTDRLKGGLPSDASGLTLETDIEFPKMGRRSIRVTASRLTKDPHHLVVVLQDVTEVRQRQRELEGANVELHEADRRKSDFIGMMAHEVRTPLTAMNASLEIVRASADPSAVASIDILARSIARITRLSENLYDLLRRDDPRAIPSMDPIDLLDLAKRAMEVEHDAAASGHVRLTLDGKGRHLTHGPKDRILSLIMNLIDNAVRVSPADGIVRIRVRRIGDEEVLEVEDSGVGFAEDELASFFRPFESGLEGRGGLALGLSVGASLAKVLGGSLEGESAGPGRGATFRLRLPAQPGLLRSRQGPSRAARARAPGVHVGRKPIPGEEVQGGGSATVGG